jgi:hypothetical protein
MSSLQFAYSEELDEVISIDDAYNFFWQGRLSNKQSFSCPGNNCDAQVTCACMDTKEVELKQAPNFRVYGEHSQDCEYMSFLQKEGYVSSNRTVEDSSEQNCAEFILERKQKPLETQTQTSPKDKVGQRQKVSGGYSPYSARPKYYSIRPIVDKFFDFHEDGVLSERFIKVNSDLRTYKQLFKGIFNQKSENIDDRLFIYWGLAFVNRTKKNDTYQVRFSGTFIHNGKEIRPSIFIKDSQLEEFKSKKRLEQYLNFETVEKSIQVFAFVYGYPVLIPKGEQAYVNFEVSNLDYLDFKSKKYFDKLKRTEFS